MQINELFQKPIDRRIQGVVKIGQDEESVKQDELEEYVVTKELNKHFDKFFDSYRKGVQSRTDKMGVWISGFFGSGKSHFLKILSYLLSNEQVDGKTPMSFFSEKIADNRILADMKVASDATTDVILFNIDAKSDADSKANKEAIVKVFNKVFNEMQGFCGSMPWLADIERQMTKDGVYEAFKAKFEEISGDTWEEKRDDFYFEEDSIVEALAATTKMSETAARNWYQKGEENYSLDIKTFAIRVREYIEYKTEISGKKHFVVFLCDEVGQYIGSDNNLMLNLQTVTEELGSECGGRAWIIATSQEDIDSITKVSRDNFSKILGRFDTRLSLSSANVDEVIKKRLLAKTDVANETLKLIYADKSAVIKNLITFSQDTPEKKLYANENDFAEVYPFIPYQFNLLQAVFTGIRTHGASGKHLSEGERSLLNAFQEAGIEFSTKENGTLIPFNVFYKTIETFLDHNIKTVILRAETNNHLESFDVEVLKVLFMIKYIGNTLPSNIENITTIMLTNIDEDKIETQKAIDAALRRLEREKLIIKNGAEYIFLTNEEQDINSEIKDIRVDPSEILDKVADEIFNELFGLNKKFRYSDKCDFPYNTIIDDRARGTQKEEIGARVITPQFIHRSEADLKSLSIRERNVIVVMPNDASFLEEMEQSMQIEEYLRKNNGKTVSDVIEDIKSTKTRESRQRKERCREFIKDGLREAEIYINGQKLDVKTKDPTERVNQGLRALIDVTYTKLNYIKKNVYSSDNLRELLLDNGSQIVMDGLCEDTNKLAIQEMKDIISNKAILNLSITMKTLLDIFGKIPYGWNEMDIAGIVISLFKTQDIRLELSGETLFASDVQVVNYTTKRDYLDRLVIKIRERVPGVHINIAKQLAKELFIVSNMSDDEDSIMTKFKQLSNEEANKKEDSIKDLLNKYETIAYPGKAVLEKGKKLFEQVDKIREVKEFYTYLYSHREDFEDYAEDVQEIRKFFKNQSGIFKKSVDLISKFEKNATYILDNLAIETIGKIREITKLASPYSKIHELPGLNEKFIVQFCEILDTECIPIYSAIESDRAVVLQEIESLGLQNEFISQANASFNKLKKDLEYISNIYEAVAKKVESERFMIRTIEEVNEFDKTRKELEASQNQQTSEEIAPVKIAKVKAVTIKSIMPNKNQIKTSADVEEFVKTIRENLIKQLEDETTIKIV